MNVIKRDGSEAIFDQQKIFNAVSNANKDVADGDKITERSILSITDNAVAKCKVFDRALNVEEIQDIVEKEISKAGYHEAAKQYIIYRYKRTLARRKNSTDDAMLAILNGGNEEVKQENSNKNPTILSVQRDYLAGTVSKDLVRRYFMPDDVMQAHDSGLCHVHDCDYIAANIHNCDLVNLEDMLQNGTVISGTTIDKPKSFLTACNIATQIIAQVASSQFGGQSISLTHLAPFVDVSRQRIKAEMKELVPDLDDDKLNEITEKKLRKEISSGVQTIQYQLLTLQTTNGQTPFVTVFMYLGEAPDPKTKADLALIIEETLKQRMIGVKNNVGVYVTPAFPKLIFVTEEDNIREGSKYFYLTKLAAKCTAKRMVPDYISEKIMKQLKQDADGNGYCYPVMGCRSALTVWRDENKKAKFYGRFNQGVVSVNLAHIGLEADRDLDKFWKIFDERLELCHKALQFRHNRLVGTKSDVAPILWQYGAIARLKPGETIDKLLYGGYSTISLGYFGLWECVLALNGKKLTDPEGEALGLMIMKKLNEYTAKWKAVEHVDYSLYGTPAESLCYKFAKANQRDFGIIKDITDHSYGTNSYHVCVREPIDAFSKLALEAKFQKLSPGGAISYVEVPNMQNNIPAVISIIQFMYDNIMYAELNSKSDYCQVCGFDGEIEIYADENGKLGWKCPHCGNTDQTKMNVVRRTCGYLGSQYWNAGRTAEIKDRVLHVD